MEGWFNFQVLSFPQYLLITDYDPDTLLKFSLNSISESMIIFYQR